MSAAFANESKWDRFNPLHDGSENPESTDCYDEYGAYLPTQHQIEAACSRIQSEWSPRERRKRYVGDIGDLMWNLPECRLQNAG